MRELMVRGVKKWALEILGERGDLEKKRKFIDFPRGRAFEKRGKFIYF